MLQCIMYDDGKSQGGSFSPRENVPRILRQSIFTRVIRHTEALQRTAEPTRAPGMRFCPGFKSPSFRAWDSLGYNLTHKAKVSHRPPKTALHYFSSHSVQPGTTLRHRGILDQVIDGQGLPYEVQGSLRVGRKEGGGGGGGVKRDSYLEPEPRSLRP